MLKIYENILRIFLVGFMGTGKTEVGKNLAKKFKKNFIDIDKEIERKKHKTIPEIFKEDGEKKFREYERNTLEKLINQKNIIVATGGGIVLSKINRKLMKETGFVIWLFASPSEILRRVKKETHRPLIEGRDKFNRIKELLNKRIKYYNEVSDFTIDTDNLSVSKVTRKILDFLSSF